MKRTSIYLTLATLILSGVAGVHAQRQGRTTLTGTALIYGTGLNTRTVTRSFTLHLSGVTPASEAERMFAVLESGGQEAFLREMEDKDLGRFSLGGRVGPRVNAVLVDSFEGRQRIRVIFARWIGFGELRYGRRSVDYPFSYLEIMVDPRTGRGDGSYFQAARIRARRGSTIEIEDFGTFPSKLMGVQMRGLRLG